MSHLHIVTNCGNKPSIEDVILPKLHVLCTFLKNCDRCSVSYNMFCCMLLLFLELLQWLI
jgi:hypothetical protein